MHAWEASAIAIIDILTIRSHNAMFAAAAVARKAAAAKLVALRPPRGRADWHAGHHHADYYLPPTGTTQRNSRDDLLMTFVYIHTTSRLAFIPLLGLSASAASAACWLRQSH